MIAWLLKLLILFLNTRSTFKAIRPTGSAGRWARDRGAASNTCGTRTDTTQRKQLKAELANWTVWVCVCVLEKVADRTAGYVVPLYGTIKSCALVMVLLWRGAGSQIIFDKVIKPLLRPYERPLDLVGFVASELLDLSFAALLYLPRWAAKKWNSKIEPDIPAILRGLRQPHQPQLARSLADSIEHANDQSEKVNARLSQPVTVKLQPFRPQRLSSAVPATIPPPARPPSAGLPPPPVASSAPFRPVTVAAPSLSLPRSRQAQPPPPPLASTSRLPIPATRPAPTAPSQLAPTPSTSLHPSLASVSAPLPFNDLVSQALSTAGEAASASASQTTLRSATVPRATWTTSKGSGKAKARAREDSTDTDKEFSRPPPKRTRTRSSRATAVEPVRAPSPELVDLAEMEEVEVQGASPPRSLSPPPRNRQAHAPPATPAPPGAFSFLSPHPTPQPVSLDTSASSPREMQLDQPESGQEASVATSPPNKSNTAPPRRRTRQSLAAALVREEEDVTANDVARTTPRKKTAVEQVKSTEQAATPRQKALGAIAQLSKDLLLDGEDGDGLGLSSPKKRGLGVLGRSTVGKGSSKGVGRDVEAVKPTRRTRTRSAAEDDGEYAAPAEVEQEKPSPRKRKATAPPAEDVEDRPVAKSTKRSAIATKTSTTARSKLGSNTTAASKTTTRTRTARTTTSSDAAPPSAPSRSRCRLATSTSAARAPSRASSPAAGAGEDGTEMVRSVRSNGNGKAPVRKARRVVLGRGGATVDEDGVVEEEGVQPPARRRRAAKK
ncbi:hypothetical protein JCM11641_005100 [Rhodosporidiobolus odoratus]